MFNPKDIPNREQQAVLDSKANRVFCQAGPGTGKTKLLAFAITQSLDAGVPAKRILALSFSRRATRQLRTRVDELAGEAASAVQILTTHSLGWRLIAESGSSARIKELLDGYGDLIEQTDTGKTIRDTSLIRELAQYLSYCTAQGLQPDPEEYPEVPLSVLYAQILQLGSTGTRTFDDLIAEPFHRLRDNGSYAASIGARYEIIMADEVQDLTNSQLDLIDLIAGPTGKLLVVGDRYQAIYGFRFAFLRNLDRLIQSCEQHTLTVNYRSTQQIVNVAHAMLAEAPRLVAHQGDGGLPTVTSHNRFEAEAAYVAETIARRISAGVPPECIAVVNRTRSPFMQALRVELIVRGVPHLYAGEPLDPLTSDWFQALRLFLRCAFAPDKVPIERLLLNHVPLKRAAGAREVLLEPMEAFEASELAIRCALDQPDDADHLLGTFVKWYRTWSINTGKAAQREARSLEAAVRVCNSEHTAAFLLERLDLALIPRANAVTLTTIHSAKGDEWDEVFCTQFNDKHMPIERVGCTWDEELRAAYVAVTRAKKVLYISYSTKPSSFLTTSVLTNLCVQKKSSNEVRNSPALVKAH